MCRERQKQREEQIPVTKQLETKFKGGSMKRFITFPSKHHTAALLG